MKNDFTREPMPYGSVLIVDDVETNIRVATGLMNPYRLKITTASNGAKAIDIVKSGEIFDVIFMDHMMPEIDGVETARQIRETGYNQPIVMLTANQNFDKSDIFLNSKFDEFMSKPIDVSQLDSVLNKFIKDKQSAEVIESARSLFTADNNSNIDSDSSILLDSFVKDARKAVSVLEELSDFDNKEILQKFITTIHGIKSSLWNIGEKKLSDEASILERAGRDGDTELIELTSEIFLDKLRCLSENAQRLAPVDSGQINTKVSCEKLCDIAEMCCDYNRKGALGILEKMGNSSIVSRIKEHIQHSDFEEAQSMARGVARYDGDEKVYLKVINSYVKSVGNIIGEIDTNEISDYEIKVHGIKGASRDIFANEISEAAEALEIAAKSGDVDYIRRCNADFVESVQGFVTGLGNMIAEIRAENPKPKTENLKAEILSRLFDAAKAFDIDSADCAMEALEEFDYTSEYDNDLVRWLRDKLDNMRFNEITEKLKEKLSNI